MARTGDNGLVPLLGTWGGAPTFAADLTNLADDVAQSFALAPATKNDLPTSGNWPGRKLRVQDTGYEYTWFGGAWKRGVPAPVVRNGVLTHPFLFKQTGFVKLTGSGGPFVSAPITFSEPYSGIPAMTANMLGYKATGAYNDASGLSFASERISAEAPSATGFTLYLSTTTTLSASFDWYINWVAEGPS